MAQTAACSRAVSPRVRIDIMALAALAGAMLLWSGTFIAMKVALTAFHPIPMTFFRMLASFCLLLPFALRWKNTAVYTPGDWRIFALLVIAEPCMYFMFEAHALRYTTASQAGMITSLLPLTVAVGAFFVLKERLGRAAWMGFFLAVGGVVWMTLAGENAKSAPSSLLGNLLELNLAKETPESASNVLLGNSLEVGAMLMATIYTLCARRLAGYHPFLITATQAGAGTLFFGLLLFMPGVSLPVEFPQGPTLMLCFLAVASIFAYGLYNLGVARLSAGQAAAWINLIPVLTLLMGIFLLGETLTLSQSFALIPIILGVALSQFGGSASAKGR